MTDQDKLSLTQFLQAKSYRLDGRGVHIDIDAFVSFLDMYKPSDLVYPQVVVKNFGVSRVYAAKLLDLCAEYGVVQKAYEVYCPHCQRDSGNMFASKEEVAEEVCCNNCGEIIAEPEENLSAVYKIVG